MNRKINGKETNDYLILETTQLYKKKKKNKYIYR